MKTEVPCVVRKTKSSDEKVFLCSATASVIWQHMPGLKDVKRWFPTLAWNAVQSALCVLEDMDFALAYQEETDCILGSIAYESDTRTLGSVYVKKSFGRQGIGRGLMDFAFGEIGPNAEPVQCAIPLSTFRAIREKWNLVDGGDLPGLDCWWAKAQMRRREWTSMQSRT